MLPWWTDVTIVQSDVTIVVPWQLLTGSIHDYLFCYCPLGGILFELLRIVVMEHTNEGHKDFHQDIQNAIETKQSMWTFKIQNYC